MLDVYIDFKSPEAYLAFAPTLALQERGIAVRWLPYNTVQRGIPELPEQATKGDIHRRIRAQLRVSTHQLYAKLRKLPMHFRDQPGVTYKALAALAHQPFNAKFVELAFDAYWNAQRDLDDASVVDELLERSGADLKFADIDKDTTQVESILEQAKEAGVFDVPAYVVADQLFIGREHLPWVIELCKR